MSKEVVTNPSMSNREKEAAGLGAEREYTIDRRLRNIALKTFVFLFIFSLGFILSELRFTVQIDQVGNPYQSVEVFVYDTEQKIESYYAMFERDFSEKTGLSSESPEVKEWMVTMREQGRPLVAVGPFVVFADNDGGGFSVREIQSFKQEKGLLLPLVMLKYSEQSKCLFFVSSEERGCRLPRFYAQFDYSEDGIYKRGSFSVHKDGKPERIYIDKNGIGFFDVLNIFENDKWIEYRLNGLSWELVNERTLPETLKTLEDGLVKEYRRLYGNKGQEEYSDSNDNQDANAEQIDTSESLDDSPCTE